MKMSNELNANIRFGLQIVIGFFMAVGAWFTKGISDNQKSLDQKITTVLLDHAEIRGNRFSSNDWVKAKEIMDTRMGEHDKRITRQEDLSIALKETSGRIESSLREIKDKLSKGSE
jgi:hypothetical protein